MAVKSREELLDFVNKRFPDDTSEEVLGFIEDISDTYDDMSRRINESGDWKKKYESNDSEWRKKYRDRFFANTEDLQTELDKEVDREDLSEVQEEKKKVKYEELFKEVK